MPRKTYVTDQPDKTGALLRASRLITKYNGNVCRVNYNKAVDPHNLFIDVEADELSHEKIAVELKSIGYLNRRISETRVIIIEINIPDRLGAMLPVLKVLDRYDVNITCFNSSFNDTSYQCFKMGLLIENPKLIKMLLDDLSELYQINIADYDDFEKVLDNTVFYIRLANEMQKSLGLSTEKTMEFISESGRILRRLQETGENPVKVFDYIRRFVRFIGKYQGNNFKADIQKLQINETVALYSIQPPCGSNTYIFETTDELTLIDTGYAIYAGEMFNIFDQLFPRWEKRIKKVFITHADTHHCGLLSLLNAVKIGLNKKSAARLQRPGGELPDWRETNDFGYSGLSRIISGYMPPNTEQFAIIDSDTPREHDELIKIGNLAIADLSFEVWEGSGGHFYGEMVFVCPTYGIIFTGDNLININGFSPERSEFDSLAPYLMRSVNVDSQKATAMRYAIIQLIEQIENQNQKPCFICGGHGPISQLVASRMVNCENVEKVLL